MPSASGSSCGRQRGVGVRPAVGDAVGEAGRVQRQRDRGEPGQCPTDVRNYSSVAGWPGFAPGPGRTRRIPGRSRATSGMSSPSSQAIGVSETFWCRGTPQPGVSRSPAAHRDRVAVHHRPDPPRPCRTNRNADWLCRCSGAQLSARQVLDGCPHQGGCGVRGRRNAQHPLEAVRPGGPDRGERLLRHLQVTAGREGAVAGAGDDHDANPGRSAPLPRGTAASSA